MSQPASQRWAVLEARRRRIRELPQFIRTTMLDIVQHGAIEIETAFEYQPLTAQGANPQPPIQQSFRTCIQLDGDVLNFIPAAAWYANDPAWSDILQAQRHVHQAKVTEFFTKLRAFELLGQKAARWSGGLLSGTAATGNNAPALLVTEPTILISISTILLIGAAGAVTFDYVVRPVFIRFIRYYFVEKYL